MKVQNHFYKTINVAAALEIKYPDEQSVVKRCINAV